MISRRAVLVLGVGVSAGVLVGCSSGSSPILEAPSQVSLGRLRDLVAEFSEIWRRGSWGEFSSFVAPENIAVVKRTFMGIHSLPHVETDLVLAVDNQPLVAVKDGEKFDIDGFIRHRVVGVDQAPLLSPASYSFSKDSSGAVKLVGFSSRPGEWVAPWDLGEIAAVVSDHVTVMCPIGEKDFVKGLIYGYEKKFLELKSGLEGLGIPERVVVYQGRNAISESVFAQSRYPNSDESKYYRGMFFEVPTADKNYDAPRIAMATMEDEYNKDAQGYEYKEVYEKLFLHELTHVVQHSWNINKKRVPKWIIEGSAFWAEYAGAIFLFKDLFPKDEIIGKYIDRLGELITDVKDPEKFRKFEYAVSGAFFSWVDSKVGRPKTWQMIKDAFSTGNISESIAKPLGVNTVAELMPEFRDWFSQLPS